MSASFYEPIFSYKFNHAFSYLFDLRDFRDSFNNIKGFSYKNIIGLLLVRILWDNGNAFLDTWDLFIVFIENY